MKKRLIHTLGVLVLAVLVTLVIWQGSFTFGDYGPSGPDQTLLFWAVSTLIFILTVTIGFMLFRAAVRLYIERHSNREGSRIKTKLVAGALALSFTPVFFLVLWSISVLNRNLDKWFTRPAEDVKIDLKQFSGTMDREATEKAAAQARWIAALGQSREALSNEASLRPWFQRLCRQHDIVRLELLGGGAERVMCASSPDRPVVQAEAAIEGGGVVRVLIPVAMDLAAKQREIQQHIAEYDQLAVNKKEMRRAYHLLMVLITLFIVFVATWIAQYLARLISVPIAALLEAAREVRSGNLSYRVRVGAIDELATLVRAFNEMTQDLETNSRELERRRRFTEAILESIPTGVISLAGDGKIRKVNSALARMLPEERVARASRIDELFDPEDAAEIRYLMNRARRTGQPATRQFTLESERKTLHVAVTAAALEERVTSGFVILLEDTSELLHAQKTAAWNEVARRIAHEIKNPLTPIGLCAERIGRQLEKVTVPADAERILRECSVTISREVQSLKSLVDAFSQFARFPASHPAPADLNGVVAEALSIFSGRLDGIDLRTELAPDLPQVNIDREHFKRVVVNLVDNAAEAMQHSLVKRMCVATSAPSPETVELVIADTGCGVSPDEKEKLFLPYFSTKGRGTGLGLAIVNHILLEHKATIRVEDNLPAGARFVVEIPSLVCSETEPKTVEMRA